MKICGLDECGRGPLAGPIVAAAAVLSTKGKVQKLNDSKKLSPKQRDELYKKIIDSGALVQVEIISARQINNRGIGWANKEIFRRLVKRIDADKYIVDGALRLGRIQGKGNKVKSVVGADATRKCVMAASIIAKVTRDRMMNELHKQHPMYGWDRNVGYGTKVHIQAIKEFGVCRYHRDVFVRTALQVKTY